MFIAYAPFVFLNYAQIRDDYNFWQKRKRRNQSDYGFCFNAFLNAFLDIFALLLEFCVLEFILPARLLLLLPVDV